MSTPTRELLDELRSAQSPSITDRERVRHKVRSAIGAGNFSPTALRVDAAMHAAARGPAAWLTGKWMLSTVVVAIGMSSMLAWNGQLNRDRRVATPTANVTHSPPPSAASQALANVPAATIPKALELDSGAKSNPPRAAASDAHAQPPSSMPASERTTIALTRTAAARHLPRPATIVVPSEAAAPNAGAGKSTAQGDPITADTTAVVQPTAAAKPPTPVLSPTFHLADDIALLRRADGALRNRDPAGALQLLKLHAERFAQSGLAHDREGLRAIAQCMQRAPGAPAVRDGFLSSDASSPLAQRVRHACAEAP